MTRIGNWCDNCKRDGSMRLSQYELFVAKKAKGVACYVPSGSDRSGNLEYGAGPEVWEPNHPKRMSTGSTFAALASVIKGQAEKEHWQA